MPDGRDSQGWRGSREPGPSGRAPQPDIEADRKATEGGEDRGETVTLMEPLLVRESACQTAW